MSKVPIRRILVFAMHQLLGTWGVAIAAAFLVFASFEILRPLSSSLFVSHNAHVLLTELHYFPTQIILALWSGWSFGRRFQHQAMLWVWVLPFLLLCYAVVAVPRLTPDIVFTSVIMQATENHSSLSHYFGSACHVENGCIDQLIITMPFYVSVFYSLGALLARIYPGTSNLSGVGYKGGLTPG